MDTSAIYSKLASNKVLILPLISSLLLAGCNSNVNNQPTSFCELVDPNSKYYAPNTLTLDQLATCRLQAEKILAIQAMQIQIHRQRDAVISASNSQTNGGTEITKALNSLSSTDLEITPAATNRPTNTTARTQQKTPKTSTQSSRIANANKNTTKIIAQQTAVMPTAESVQQRYLNDASANPQANQTTRQPQALQNAEQAARVAKQIDDLLQSQAAQTVLNQPRALLPGEETRKTDIISQINSRNNVASTTPTTTSSTNTTTSNSTEIKQAVETPAVTNSAISEQAPVTQQNSNDVVAHTNATTSQDNPEPTSSTQLNAPAQSTGKLSTDYTSQPPASNPQTSDTTVETNPVAQIIKPIEARNNPVTTTQNKTHIDYYDPTPLPSLNDTNGLTPTAPKTAAKPDPLAHLQQKRIENK